MRAKISPAVMTLVGPAQRDLLPAPAQVPLIGQRVPTDASDEAQTIEEFLDAAEAAAVLAELAAEEALDQRVAETIAAAERAHEVEVTP